MEMKGCHGECSEAIFVFASRLVRDCFIIPLLSNDPSKSTWQTTRVRTTVPITHSRPRQ